LQSTAKALDLIDAAEQLPDSGLRVDGWH
jgi:hypothetical protein